MGLAIAALIGVSALFLVVIRNRNTACRVNLRILELSQRLSQIDKTKLSNEQLDVLKTAENYLAMAENQYRKGDFVAVDQSLSLGHLNAHSAETPSDAHGFKH